MLTPMVLTPSRTSIALQLNVSAPGNLYCAAVRRGSAEESLATAFSVKSGGTQVVALTAGVITMDLINLSPNTDYSVLCYTEDFRSHTMPTAVMIEGKAATRTLCCTQVIFDQYPSPVRARNLSSSGDPEVFKLRLESTTFYRAMVNVTITPNTSAVHCSSAVSGVVAQAVARPSGFLLLNGSTAPSFLVMGTPGCYILSTTLTMYETATDYSGHSGVQSVTQYPLSILSLSAPSPAPKIATVIFSNDGLRIIVTFDGATDSGVGVVTASATGLGRGLCSSYFLFPSAAQALCTWQPGGAQVEISYPNGTAGSSISLLTVGDPVSVQDNTLRALRCLGRTTSDITQCPFMSSSVVATVRGPVQPLSPVVSLTASQTVSKCDAITLDPTLTTGDAGRTWTSLRWFARFTSRGVLSAGSSYNYTIAEQQITHMLNQNYSSTQRLVTIPNNLLAMGTLEFTLELQNFLGRGGRATVSSTVSNSVASPSVSISGSKLVVVPRSHRINLQALAAIPACAGNFTLSSLKYTWMLYKGTTYITTITNTALDPRNYILEPYTLAALTLYTVQVLVNVNNQRSIPPSSASVKLQMVPGGVVARLTGGSARRIGGGSVFTLDASPSYNDDDPTNLNSLTFTWSCVDVTLAYYGEACVGIDLTGTYVNTVNLANYKNILSSRYLQFTVTVSANGGTSVANATTTVEVYSTAAIPIVTLPAVRPKYNPQEKILIVGSIAASARTLMVWSLGSSVTTSTSSATSSLTQGSSLLNATASTSSSVFLTAGTRTIAAGRSTFQQAIAANALTAGLTYRVRLSVKYLLDGAVESFSEIVLKMNSPPANGGLLVVPSKGTELETNFYYQTYGWTDDATDYPLTFNMEYYSQSNLLHKLVKPVTQLTYAYSTMGRGMKQFNYNVTCVATATDIYSSSASAIRVVQVLPSATLLSGSAGLLTAVTAQLTQAITTSNPSAVAQVISTVTENINDVNCTLAGASFCAALNRLPCYRTTQTCSGCVSGYVGTYSDVNQLCVSSTAAVVTDTATDTGSTDPTALFALHHNCTADSECLSGHCSPYTGRCTAQQKVCPNDCSGRGACVFTNYSASIVSECEAQDPYCTANCACQSGYYGKDCSLTQSALTYLRAMREKMCAGLLHTITLEDAAVDALSNRAVLIGELLSDPAQVTSPALWNCTLALIQSVLAQPVLTGTVAQTYVQTISTVLDNSALPSTLLESLNDAYNSLTQGVQATLAIGEAMVNVTTKNVRFGAALIATNDSDAASSAFHVPQSEYEVLHAAVPTALTVDLGSEITADAGSSGTDAADAIGVGVFGYNKDVLNSAVDATMSSPLQLTNRPASAGVGFKTSSFLSSGKDDENTVGDGRRAVRRSRALRSEEDGVSSLSRRLSPLGSPLKKASELKDKEDSFNQIMSSGKDWMTRKTRSEERFGDPARNEINSNRIVDSHRHPSSQASADFSINESYNVWTHMREKLGNEEKWSSEGNEFDKNKTDPDFTWSGEEEESGGTVEGELNHGFGSWIPDRDVYPTYPTNPLSSFSSSFTVLLDRTTIKHRSLQEENKENTLQGGQNINGNGRVLSAGSSSGVTVTLHLPNLRSIAYYQTNPEVGIIDCLRTGVPHNITLNCTSLVDYVFECPGVYGQQFNYTCPMFTLTPFCTTWDASSGSEGYAPDQECVVAAYSSDSTTCACNPPAASADATTALSQRLQLSRARALQSSSTGASGDSSLTQFSSQATVVITPFAKIINYVGPKSPPAVEYTYTIVAVLSSLLFLLLMFLVYYVYYDNICVYHSAFLGYGLVAGASGKGSKVTPVASLPLAYATAIDQSVPVCRASAALALNYSYPLYDEYGHALVAPPMLLKQGGEFVSGSGRHTPGGRPASSSSSSAVVGSTSLKGHRFLSVENFFNALLPKELTGLPWYKRLGEKLMNEHDWWAVFQHQHYYPTPASIRAAATNIGDSTNAPRTVITSSSMEGVEGKETNSDKYKPTPHQGKNSKRPNSASVAPAPPRSRPTTPELERGGEGSDKHRSLSPSRAENKAKVMEKWNEAMTAALLFQKKDTWVHTSGIHHELKSLRWLLLFGRLLNFIFFTTVFVRAFYSDDGTCEHQVLEEQCISKRTVFSLSHMCDWNPTLDSACTFNPLSINNPLAILVLAGLATLTSIPFDHLFYFVVLRVKLSYTDVASAHMQEISANTAHLHHKHIELLKVKKTNQVVPISQTGAVGKGGAGVKRPATAKQTQSIESFVHNEPMQYASGNQTHSSGAAANYLHAGTMAYLRCHELANLPTNRSILLLAARFVLIQNKTDKLSAKKETQLLLQDIQDGDVVLQMKPTLLHTPGIVMHRAGSGVSQGAVALYSLLLGRTHQVQPLNTQHTPLPAQQPARPKRGRVLLKADPDTMAYVSEEVKYGRAHAKHIKKTLGSLTSDLDKEAYLVQQFLVECLPPLQRRIASLYLFRKVELAKIGLSNSALFGCFAVLLLYMAFMIGYCYWFGQHIGSRAALQWVEIVLICIGYDMLVLQPVKIWMKHVALPSVATSELRTLHALLKERARSVLTRTYGVVQNYNQLIQHSNPACRAARTFPELAASRLLIALNDNDLPVHLWRSYQWSFSGIFFTLAQTVLMAIFAVPLLLLPIVMHEFSIDSITTVILNLLLIGLVLLSTINLFIPIGITVAVVLLVCVLVLYNYRQDQRRKSLIFASKAEKIRESQDFVSRMMLATSDEDFELMMQSALEQELNKGEGGDGKGNEIEIQMAAGELEREMQQLLAQEEYTVLYEGNRKKLKGMSLQQYFAKKRDVYESLADKYRLRVGLVAPGGLRRKPAASSIKEGPSASVGILNNTIGSLSDPMELQQGSMGSGTLTLDAEDSVNLPLFDKLPAEISTPFKVKPFRPLPVSPFPPSSTFNRTGGLMENVGEDGEGEHKDAFTPTEESKDIFGTFDDPPDQPMESGSPSKKVRKPEQRYISRQLKRIKEEKEKEQQRKLAEQRNGTSRAEEDFGFDFGAGMTTTGDQFGYEDTLGGTTSADHSRKDYFMHTGSSGNNAMFEGNHLPSVWGGSGAPTPTVSHTLLASPVKNRKHPFFSSAGGARPGSSGLTRGDSAPMDVATMNDLIKEHNRLHSLRSQGAEGGGDRDEQKEAGASSRPLSTRRPVARPPAHLIRVPREIQRQKEQIKAQKLKEEEAVQQARAEEFSLDFEQATDTDDQNDILPAPNMNESMPLDGSGRPIKEKLVKKADISKQPEAPGVDKSTSSEANSGKPGAEAAHLRVSQSAQAMKRQKRLNNTAKAVREEQKQFQKHLDTEFDLNEAMFGGGMEGEGDNDNDGPALMSVSRPLTAATGPVVVGSRGFIAPSSGIEVTATPARGYTDQVRRMLLGSAAASARPQSAAVPTAGTTTTTNKPLAVNPSTSSSASHNASSAANFFSQTNPMSAAAGPPAARPVTAAAPGRASPSPLNTSGNSNHSPLPPPLGSPPGPIIRPSTAGVVKPLDPQAAAQRAIALDAAHRAQSIERMQRAVAMNNFMNSHPPHARAPSAGRDTSREKERNNNQESNNMNANPNNTSTTNSNPPNKIFTAPRRLEDANQPINTVSPLSRTQPLPSSVSSSNNNNKQSMFTPSAARPASAYGPVSGATAAAGDPPSTEQGKASTPLLARPTTSRRAAALQKAREEQQKQKQREEERDWEMLNDDLYEQVISEEEEG